MPAHVPLFAGMTVCARARMLCTSEDTWFPRDARGIPTIGSYNVVRNIIALSVQHDVSSDEGVHTSMPMRWTCISISYCRVHILSEGKWLKITCKSKMCPSCPNYVDWVATNGARMFICSIQLLLVRPSYDHDYGFTRMHCPSSELFVLSYCCFRNLCWDQTKPADTPDSFCGHFSMDVVK